MKWLGFVLRIYPLNLTPVGAIPVNILHPNHKSPWGFARDFFPTSILRKSHWDFFLNGEAFPLVKINPYMYFTSNLGRKTLWKFEPYFIDIIGINSPCQMSIGIRDLIHKVTVTFFAGEEK